MLLHLNKLQNTMNGLRCKAEGATVQGAISAAAAIAMLQAQGTSAAPPWTLLMQCPASMRRHVRLFDYLLSKLAMNFAGDLINLEVKII